MYSDVEMLFAGNQLMKAKKSIVMFSEWTTIINK